MASDTDKSYAAGIIDGEGSICVHSSHGHKNSGKIYPQIRVKVEQVDPEICTWLKETFGGCLYIRQAKHCKNGILYIWLISCRKAADFLELTVPYLKLKKSRAEAAIKLARGTRRVGAVKGNRFVLPLTEEEKSERLRLAMLVRSKHSRNQEVVV